ncbi:mucin-2 [Drosophila santomea]|uniref:mucin-2 n=1 Tax=Drosophila santomea TaxID=129105 RepID=UPI001953C015|nr:mucin-2 [Drosophila santomea]
MHTDMRLKGFEQLTLSPFPLDYSHPRRLPTVQRLLVAKDNNVSKRSRRTARFSLTCIHRETREPAGGQILQQIPLTYFRTYTYQPLAPGFFGFGAAQTPLLPGAQYDPYGMTSYAAARRHDSASRQEVTAPAELNNAPSSARTTSTTAAPTTTSTTTTTTTTPAPTTRTSTTTTSTTTTTTPPPVPPPPQSTSSSFSEGSTSSLLRFGEYPAYNRRVSNLYNARPQYPYPDYFNYQQMPQQQSIAAASEHGGVPTNSRIQFVPCMCPVSMPSFVSSASSTAATLPPQPSTSSTAFVSQPAARHIEGQELEAEADGETDNEGEEEDEDEEQGQEQEQEQGQSQSQTPGGLEDGASKAQLETQDMTSDDSAV